MWFVCLCERERDRQTRRGRERGRKGEGERERLVIYICEKPKQGRFFIILDLYINIQLVGKNGLIIQI
jgi:hypothetical protein